MQGTSSRFLKLSLLAVVALAAVGLGLGTGDHAAGQTASVVAVAPSSWPVDGGPFQVNVEVSGVSNLAAFQFAIGFNPAVLQFVGVQEGPFLGSTGRDVLCPPLNLDIEKGELFYGCASLGDQAGPSGSGLLATITFAPVATGISDLPLSRVELGDPEGGRIDSTASGACIVIVRPGGGPTSCPSATATPRPGAPTPTPTGPTPTPTGPTPTPTPLPPGFEAVALAAGCNALASTYPDHTPVQTIASSVGPAGILTSLWEFEQGAWLGYSPQFPEVSDLTEKDFLDVVFICVTGPGSFARPVV